MFLKYTKKDKKKFIIAKLSIFLLIVLMGYLAIKFAGLNLEMEEKVAFGSGVILVAIVGTFAFLNRMKVLFKFKSIKFVIAFVIFLLLKVGIDALVWATGLISIPLLIDDIVIVNYFKWLDVVKYDGQP